MKPLAQMTVPELRQYARDCGMSTITKLDNKDKLIQAINRQRAKYPGRYIHPDEILTCAIYVRISSDREGKEYGIERQEKDCRDLAFHANLRVVQVYRENDTGASTRSKKPRPEYDRMIAAAKAGKFQVIVCATSSRLTRRPLENETLIQLAETIGIRYRYVKSPDFDLNTPDGRAVARTLAAWDAAESERISDRVADAREQRVCEHGGFGGGRRPFGFAANGIDLVETEAAIVRKFSQRVLTGASIRELHRELVNAGVPTASGGKWSAQTLRDILIRPRNAGLTVHRGEVVGQGCWKPIVNVETWKAVCEKLNDPDRKTTPGPAPRWLLSGIAKCGRCAAPMRVSSSAGKKPTYECGSLRHLKMIAQPLHDFVTFLVLERLSRPDARELISPQTTPVDLGAIRAELVTLRELEANLGADYAEGLIPRETLRSGATRIRAKIETLEATLAEATSESACAPLLDSPMAVYPIWKAMNLADQRAVIRELMTITIVPGTAGVEDRAQIAWIHGDPVVRRGDLAGWAIRLGELIDAAGVISAESADRIAVLATR